MLTLVNTLDAFSYHLLICDSVLAIILYTHNIRINVCVYIYIYVCICVQIYVCICIYDSNDRQPRLIPGPNLTSERHPVPGPHFIFPGPSLFPGRARAHIPPSEAPLEAPLRSPSSPRVQRAINRPSM